VTCVSDKGQCGVHQIISGFTAVCQRRWRHRRQSYLQVCDVLRLYLTATCGNYIIITTITVIIIIIIILCAQNILVGKQCNYQ